MDHRGPKRLIVAKGLKDTPLARRLGERLPAAIIRETIRPADYHEFEAGDLILGRHDGQRVKPCPGTRGYHCCGLQIIHFGLGCHLGCTYCILQSYLDTRALVLFGHMDRFLDDLPAQMALAAPGASRFCTGEFTDSLLLEPLTGLGRRLVGVFSGLSGRSLELKTKTVNIEGLLDADHGGKTVISFSVNAPKIEKTEEIGAPPVSRRLSAAARAVKSGYRVGFHFDPIIRHAGWKDGYSRVVDEIFEAVPADRIAWISLGAFRYLPRLKDIVRRRYPHSRIMDEEFIPAPDGKMRYPRPMRVELYGRVLEKIRAADPTACVYMCMENKRVWTEVFGYDPGPQGVIDMLDQRVI